jgi:CubicO group peptidase (beta-lactamase class C family)
MRSFAFLLLGLFACKSSDPASPQTISDAGLDDVAASYDFTAMRKELFEGSWQTEGVVVMHQGKVVFEEYAKGFKPESRHITYSVSKSIGAALVGVAVKEGLLKREEKICTYYPAPAGADATFCDITVDHLLHMSSGLKWVEDYGDPAKSNILPMLYGDEADMGEYVARQPREAPAGTRWLYSSGDSNLLARVLRAALGGTDMRVWAKQKLFGPAGLDRVIFERDRSGTLVFSSSCFMTPRDMAKFGQLYLDDGVAAGNTRLLPEGWVKATQTPAPAVSTPVARNPDAGPGDSGGSYSTGFWLNAVKADADRGTWLYPQAPADTYSAEGHWGQKIMIVPSRRLVVARVGNDRAKLFDPGPMVQHAVAAVDRVGTR